MAAIGELIKHPEHTVHVELLGYSQVAQCAVPGQERPASRFGECERERVRGGQPRVLTVQHRRSAEFGGGERFNTKPKGDEPIAERPRQLALIEQIRYRELEGQAEHFLKKAGALQVDQDRRIGDEDPHVSRRHLIQPRVQYAD